MDFTKILKLGQSVHCVGFGDATVQQFPEENNDFLVLFFAENNCHRAINPNGKYVNKNSMTAIYPNLDSVKKFYPDAETAWEKFTLENVELYQSSNKRKSNPKLKQEQNMEICQNCERQPNCREFHVATRLCVFINEVYCHAFSKYVRIFDLKEQRVQSESEIDEDEWDHIIAPI